MMTGSWCLTEILMSVKPCSSNSEHSQSADSTSASGVALPYLASSRLSSDPALTPIRIGTPAADAALAISPTLSSKVLMLPGFTRTAAQPASIAANTYLGWKWISAITGICDFRAICGSASASSCDGTATRTIWQPAAVSSAICCRVAFTSAVTVVVIDCTETGAPPPTGTACFPLPTMTWRDLRRGATGSAAGTGMPRSIVMIVIASLVLASLLFSSLVFASLVFASLGDMNGIDQVRHYHQQAKPYYQGEYSDTHREQLAHVHQARIRPATQPRQPRPGPLVDHDSKVAAIERQQRK